MNLIEKCGGYEAANQLLERAPDPTADHYVGDNKTYYSMQFGSYFCADEQDWLDSDYRTSDELKAAYKEVIDLDALAAELNHETP